MARAKTTLTEGRAPITAPGIVRTRFQPTFEAGGARGQFFELVKRIGIRLNLPRSGAPELVLGTPITGYYETGTAYRLGRASLFTNTSKMPGPSFALPAGPPGFGGTCPASALGDGAGTRAALTQELPNVPLHRLPILQGADLGAPFVPGVQHSYYGDANFVCRNCYALDGNYRYPSKQIVDMAHLAWCEYELDLGGPQRLGTALAYAIQHANLMRSEGFQPYFRIHDAGDFYSERYLEAWVVCASMMRHMRFWAPTRQWVFSKWVPLLASATDRVRRAGGWLTMRPSVLRVGDPVPVIPGLSVGSGVSSERVNPCLWVCPVYNQIVPKSQPDGTVLMEEASSCLEANCTVCWDQPGVPVSYGAH